VRAEIIQALDALATSRSRAAAAAELARQLGAEALYAFVPDPARPATLIPVEGFPTLPSRRGWSDLLALGAVPGIHRGVVAHPEPGTPRNACLHAFDGLAFVVIEPRAADDDTHALLARLAGLLAALFRAELELVATRGEREVERLHAERTSTLVRALDRARGDAERATRVKDEFLAMLGHELRNPLAPIVTALQLLRMSGVATRAQDVLERQVGHMLRLIDDLLDVSRITSGKIELRKEPIELCMVVSRALEMSRPLLEQRGNQLVVDVPERGMIVDGDPARLAQVFGNLLTNASKYSDPGSRIELRGSRDGNRVRLAVIDHGMGIDAAFLDRVFDQFVQVPQGLDRSAGGLGLGLAIVRSLVAHHGGSVRATSDGPGCGSTFIVELPAGRDDAAIARPIQAPPDPGVATARILVVDDNVDAAILLAEVLGAYGYQTDVAHSGPEALTLARAHPPDAALLDIGLPVMDGYELARLLKVNRPDLKLLALTGYGQANDRERSRAAGFDAHLVKPVSIEVITGLLERLLAPPATAARS